MYKEEKKRYSKTREIVGDDFFSRVELSCNLTDFFSRQSCCRSRSRAHRQLWLNAFILFIFAVALAGLAYYTMTLQNQLAILTIHLDPGKSCKLFLFLFLTEEAYSHGGLQTRKLDQTPLSVDQS